MSAGQVLRRLNDHPIDPFTVDIIVTRQHYYIARRKTVFIVLNECEGACPITIWTRK